MSVWTNKLTQKFHDEIYTGMVTIDLIPSVKIAVKYEIEGIIQEIWGWEIPFGTQKLFLPDKIGEAGSNTLELLPIKITETEEFSYQKNVYLMVKNAGTFKVNPAKKLSLAKLVKLFCMVKHSEPNEYKDLVILGLASYVLPINWRISSSAGFGKNCLFDNMKKLCQDVQCYQPKSAPKLKKESNGRSLLVSNEFMEIPHKDKKNLEDYYRGVGDNNTSLENNSLASGAFGTKDKYDTNNLSSGVIYNLIDYYVKDKEVDSTHNQFFDVMYSFATNQRFLPQLYDFGEIDASQFSVPERDLEKLYAKYKPYYLAIVKSMLYWQENFAESLEGKEEWKLETPHVIGSTHNRLNKHYGTLVEFIKGASETEEEYNLLANNVWDKYTRYLDSVKPQRIKKLQRDKSGEVTEEGYDSYDSEEVEQSVDSTDVTFDKDGISFDLSDSFDE